MNITDLFRLHSTKSATFKRPSATIINGIKQPDTLTTVSTAECLMWLAQTARTITGQKFETEVDAVLIAKPGIDVKAGDVAEVDNNLYIVIYADDIGFQGQALVIPVKKK